MTELQTNQSKPRVIPILIASWVAIIYFMFILGPAFRESGRFTVYMVPFIVLFFSGIWAAFGTARLRTTAVRMTFAVLIGYPLFVVAKAIITGYFSFWLFGFLFFIAIINTCCGWYLLRSGVRVFWSRGEKISGT
jgi:hypothetical protein